MKILIIGAGISGSGAARLAKHLGNQVTVIDQFCSPALEEKATELRKLGIEVRLNCQPHHAEKLASMADETILSPGINPNGPFSQTLHNSKKVSSELEFGSRHCHCPVYAITGTNGKTTTVEMSVHIMRQAGLKVKAAGNIGYPVSLAAMESDKLDCLVLEVSSFQLEQIEKFKPKAVAVLNITSDHIDRYPDFDSYANTKIKLLQTVVSPEKRAVGEGMVHLLPPNFPCLIAGQTETCALKKENQACVFNNQLLFEETDLKILGEHNFTNAMFAAWFALNAGVHPNKIGPALQTFHTGKHRLEKVFANNNLTVYNDSKSTNPDSLAKALESISRNCTKNVILIAGGRDKMMDFSRTTKLVNNYVKTAILIGETKTKLRNLWQTETKCVLSENLSEAVITALNEVDPKDTILLSPGCASQDMFKDYKQRGTIFCHEILRRLNNE